jgi:uncharacterized membrane protein HdeD (DUF308 family)
LEPRPEKSRAKRVVRLVLGVLLLVLGVGGLFLPFLQGVLLIVAGFAVLGDEIPIVARLRDRIRERYPGPWREAARFKQWARSKVKGEECAGDEDRGF